jgi:hypothetical protein
MGCGKMRMPEFCGVFLSLLCLVYVSACVCVCVSLSRGDGMNKHSRIVVWHVVDRV